MSRIYEALKRALGDETADGSPRAPTIVTGGDVGYLGGEEGYQRLVQTVAGVTKQDGPQVVLVISAVHGEGASSVARGLALGLARRRATTALVDGNLYSPSQHLAFGVPQEAGLTDLAGKLRNLNAVFRDSRMPGLSVLTCHAIADGTPKILDWAALQDAVKELRGTFDRIIIDGPPVTAYPDAVALARASDGVILVLRAESTRWEVAEHAKHLLEENGCSILGAVLNRRRYHIPDSVYSRL